MSDKDRIQRLEETVGTLIGWLCYGALSHTETSRLLHMLQGDLPDVTVTNEQREARKAKPEPPKGAGK